jgi:DNA-binding SARP family transcriptional activator
MMTQHDGLAVLEAPTGATSSPILICLLGDFRVLKVGQPLALRSHGKAEALLCSLALRHAQRVPRDTLLDALWPEREAALAGQSLNTVVYGLHRLLGEAIGGASPVLHEDGYYRLNVEAGVGVDTVCFDALANAGQQQAQTGDRAAAARSFTEAVRLYRGDLHDGTSVLAVVERERLRALYLSLLASLAEYHFGEGDYVACLEHALQLLLNDPCREDAYRLVMRCYVRRGERAQALRQYRLCEGILKAEFDAAPEPATSELFDRIRLDPNGI